MAGITRTIFGSQGPRLALAEDFIPADSGEVDASLSGGSSFSALGGQFEFRGAATLGAQLVDGSVTLGLSTIQDTGESLDPLGNFEAPSGKRWADLDLRAGADISGTGSSGGAVAVTVSASADLAFEYRFVRAVPTTDDLQTAVARVLGEVLLPFSFDPKSFGPDRWYEMSLDASLSISGELAAGKTLNLYSNDGPLAGLLPSDSPEVAARLEVAAKASIGLELADNLRVGAGRLAAKTPGWVRFRLERSRSSSISFGASLAVTLWYNKEVLKRLLDAGLGRIGYLQVQERLLAIKTQVDQLGQDLTVENLRSRLSEELFDFAAKALPIDEVTGEIADTAKDLLAGIQRVKTRFTELDGEFQGLVDHLLAAGSLAPGKPLNEALSELKALGDLSRDELMQKFLGGIGDLEPLFDLLSRTSIDDLLLDGADKLHSEVSRVAGGASKVLELVQEVDDADLTDLLEKLTGSDRIRKVVDFINTAPPTPAEFKAFLKNKADSELEELIDKLVGGAVDDFSNTALGRRLENLRTWAGTVSERLANAASIDQRLKAEIDKLRDRIGFVASFTIDRTTRRTTMIDVEMEPKACTAAYRELALGKVGEFIEKLPFEKQGESDDNAEEPPFRFYHFVLASERSTTLTWLFAPTVGAGSKKSRRAFDSSRIEIADQDGQLTRTGTYSGGLVQTSGAAKEGLLRSWMGSVWLDSVGTAPMDAQSASLDAPYTEVDHEFRLATLRYDDKTTPEERAGLDAMLLRLGFPAGTFSSLAPAEATASRVKVDLRLRKNTAGGVETDPVAALLEPFNVANAGQLRKDTPLSADIDEHFLLAGSEWLGDELIDTRDGTFFLNKLLPVIVLGEPYRRRWRSFDWRDHFLVKVGARTVRVAASPESRPGADIFAPVLVSLALARGRSTPQALFQLGRAWAAAVSNPNSVEPELLVRLSRSFRRATRRTTRGITNWSSPLFQHLLVFSSLRHHVENDQLGLAGIATISWRVGEQDWAPPTRVMIP